MEGGWREDEGSLELCSHQGRLECLNLINEEAQTQPHTHKMRYSRNTRQKTKRKIRALRRQRKLHRLRVDSLQRQLQELRIQRSEESKKNQILLEATTTKNKNLRWQLGILKQECDTQREKLERTKQQAQELTNNHLNLITTYQLQLKKEEILKKNSNLLHQMKEQYRKRADDLCRELQELRKEKEQHRLRANSLQRKLEEFKEGKEQHRRRTDGLQRELEELREEKEQHRQRADGLQRELEELKEEKEQHRLRADGLQKELEELKHQESEDPTSNINLLESPTVQEEAPQEEEEVQEDQEEAPQEEEEVQVKEEEDPKVDDSSDPDQATQDRTTVWKRFKKLVVPQCWRQNNKRQRRPKP